MKLKSYFFLTLCFLTVLLFVLYSASTNSHFNEWTAVKIYPSIALANGFDLYQTKTGPYLLTQYGPGSPIFYLPTILGQSPQSVINIASCFCFIVLLLIGWALFGRRPNGVPSIVSLYLGFCWLFILFLDKTTHTLFQIHHDLPVLAYLALGSCILLMKSNSYNFIKLLLGNLFLWMAFWSKIVALPWLILPFIFKYIFPKNSLSPLDLSWSCIFCAVLGSGFFSFFFFASLFGIGDMWFHLFQSTNSYPWRECLSLLGSTGERLIPNDFFSKIYALFRISTLYLSDYWLLTISSGLILIHQLRKKEDQVVVWLVTSYFIVLPFCLASLAKFGGVANSLVFAHAPAYAALLIQVSRFINISVNSNRLKVFTAFLITLVPTFGAIRTAKAILKDPSQSPQQIAYEYLLENPDNPIFFALAPLPNYLATGKIWDSGEALSYSTMMTPNALPANAGIEGPLEMPFIAFGHPPYSRSFFSEKFDLVPDVESPKLNGWLIYRIIPKAVLKNQ